MMKLSICYTLFLYFLQTALSVEASPLSKPHSGSVRIPLTKRAPWDSPRSLDSLKAEVAYITDKYNRGFRTYRERTGTDHPLAASFYVRHPQLIANEKRSSGADQLTPDGYASMWAGNITVGAPSQAFSVDFDTGSADLFLPGPDCTESCQGHSTYDPSKSKTSGDLHIQFALQYGDGSTVEGEQYTDTVVIAGLTATGQTLGVANTYSEQLSANNFRADGLMGMGFPVLAVLDGMPVFESMITQEQTNEPVFGVRLAASYEGPSELYLGGVNYEYYTGEFAYTNVTHAAYWQVELQGVQVNGRSAVEQIPAIIDTGTTLILGDVENVRALYSHVVDAVEYPDGSGFWKVPCLEPIDVSLQFGDRAFPILPQALVIPATEAGEPGSCVGSIVADSQIQPNEIEGIDFWVVGDAFLRGVYTVFDVGNERVGFADLSSTLL